MSNVFSKLRKKLVEDNRPLLYLRYAIGEIILIVLGILLALYLNNLNDNKIIKQDQIQILQELRSNLINSTNAFERSIKYEENYMAYNLMILDYLDNRKAYDSSLDEAFGTYFWTISSNPVTGGYDYLKSKGIDLITNDSLRSNISYVFESEFAILKKENEIWANNLQQNISYPFHVKHFRKYYPEDATSLDHEYAKPFDYDKLLNNEHFKSINAEIISNRKWNINTLKNTINKIEILVAEIEEELTKMKG